MEYYILLCLLYYLLFVVALWDEQSRKTNSLHDITRM